MIWRWRHFWAMAGLLAAVAGVHGWSVGNGLYLDDHAHWETLANTRWTGEWFAEAARLDYARAMRIWWGREDRPIRFFRPGSFAIMKLQHQVSGGRPWAMHVFQLAWHAAVAWMVYTVGLRLLGSRGPAAAAMLLFAVHPGILLAVQWLAPQTLIMTGFFVLLALWAHSRLEQAPRQAGSSACATAVSAVAAGSHCSQSSGTRSNAISAKTMVLACAAAAMLCREDGVLIPAIIMLWDWIVRPQHLRGRWAWYATLWALAGLYLGARTVALGGLPTPASPYYHSPLAPGFVSYVSLKTLYYWLGLTALVPVVPVAGLIYLKAHLWLTLAAGVAVAGTVATLLWWAGTQRGQWMGFGWTWLFLAPTAPLFEGSWYMYLPAVGVCWMAGAWLGHLGRGSHAGTKRPFGKTRIAHRFRKCATAVSAVFPRAADPARPARLTEPWHTLSGAGSKVRVAGAAAICGVLVTAAVLLDLAFGYAFRAFKSVEDLVVTDVTIDAADAPPDSRLFFINLPIAAHYVMPAVRRELGRPDLEGWVLTFAPTTMGMEQPCVLEQVDAHRIRARLPEGRYFAGALGRTVMDAVGRQQLQPDERVAGDLFDVQLVGGSADGVSELVFTFHKPLASPEYRFYYGSRARWAGPIRFDVGDATTTRAAR